MILVFMPHNCMTLVFVSQKSRPCHMGKCHVGSKPDMALTCMTGKKHHKIKFGLLKPHIAFNHFMDHKYISFLDFQFYWWAQPILCHFIFFINATHSIFSYQSSPLTFSICTFQPIFSLSFQPIFFQPTRFNIFFQPTKFNSHNSLHIHILGYTCNYTHLIIFKEEQIGLSFRR